MNQLKWNRFMQMGWLVLVVVFIGYQSFAWQSQVVTSPAVVVTVDLERVFDGLTERKDTDTRLTGDADTMEQEGVSMREQIDLLIQDRDLWAPGSDEYRDLDAQIAAKSVELQAYVEFASWKLDQEKSRSLRNIYLKIKEGIAEIAEAEGFDLVVVDDSVVQLPVRVRNRR